MPLVFAILLLLGVGFLFPGIAIALGLMAIIGLPVVVGGIFLATGLSVLHRRITKGRWTP